MQSVFHFTVRLSRKVDRNIGYVNNNLSRALEMLM